MEILIGLLVMLGLVIFCLIALIKFVKKSAKKHKQEIETIKNETNAVEMIEAQLFEGLKGVNKDTWCYVTANDKGLTITTKNSNKQQFNISKEQIINFEIVTNTEIIEKFKNKKTIGRAVAGGLLFGGIGAIVGGQSGGLKATSETKINYYLIINYTNKSNETEIISFNVYVRKSKIIDYVNSIIKKDSIVNL